MMSADKKTHYEIRFRAFLREIIGVSRMKPKQEYLHSLMDSVPFKDLETAILMKNIDYGIAKNNNKGKG